MTRSPRPRFPDPTETRVSEHVESDGTRVVVILPSLDTLLGVVGFSRSDAIMLPGEAPPVDGWSLFGRRRLGRLLRLPFGLH
ncbi:hypothetical protein [Blastochloris sulfoviridis]|uniref:Uncharacterized protein n=1 Tax=Blastochloris sulfoviridis TaxID=50712 RepID=A0A5M6HTG3_9HYPH|nr:hypothetical protein [Blastochloris sulfoviridis]KAA5599203.1 hypothetical protein F1193_12770 [Blastochloris sulfoviridis]